MQTTNAKPTVLATANACHASELNSKPVKSKPIERQLGQELLATSVWTVMGTAALVGLHHRYRKQREPTASLQDYVTGARVQWQSLPSLSQPALMRFRYACQQATAAWQQAYHIDAIKDNECGSSTINSTTDFSAIHTTTMLARPVCWVSGVASLPKNIASVKDKDDTTKANDFGVVGIDADRQIVWQTTMPERVHDIVVQPMTEDQNDGYYDSSNNNRNNQNRDVVVMGRRPSEKFWVLDTARGHVKYAITATANRHFYGHACYSLDGTTLYVTENDTISLNGKIGLYDARHHYQKIAEFDAHGIGPHELMMHPDGDTLVIANGGIKTERASREELNLDTMRPSLVYLNRHDGLLLEQIMPEHNQMSVRHLAMHDDGTVMIGIQFQGAKHINVPLVLTHKRGETDFRPLIMPNNQWQRFHQYIASVAVDSKHNLLCVTTPIGGCAAIFDLNARTLIDAVSLPDCAGTSVLSHSSSKNMQQSNGYGKNAGFIVSDGQGRLTTLSISDISATDTSPSAAGRVLVDSQLHMMSFDNHLQAL